jgi:uncharacterized membrane protein YdjX (TVP38/TMEM64 family)/Fe-S oxidoreductase
MSLSIAGGKKFLSSGVAGKVALVLGIVAVLALFFGSGLHQQLTLASIKSSQAGLQQLYAERPWLAVAGFLACYLPVVVLNLPGAAVLGLVAGALFGTLAGTVLISFASTIGATLACALSRFLFRDLVQRRFAEKLQRVNAGIREEGAFYLFTLRLLPVIPFFVINLVMGLTPIRLSTFFWVSQLGMLPATLIYVNAGSQLGQLDSLAGILSPGLLAALALLGLFPLIAKRGLTWYRRSQPAMGQRGQTRIEPMLLPATISSQLKIIEEHCDECGACVKACAFLNHYGTPKAIARDHDFSRAASLAIAYQCSLCGLCTAVCPKKLDPGRLFLSLRRAYVTAGHFNTSVYRTILGYEKRGRSRLFSWQGIPLGCDTVFFPGCNLPGSRMATTLRLYEELRRTIPNLGVVLDCCSKPSHDLGRQAHFTTVFDELRQALLKKGVRRILVACPNCLKIFQQYGEGLAVQTVYECLEVKPANVPLPAVWGTVSVHDPCAMRDSTEVQQAVRRLVTGLGLEQLEMKHRGRRTLCCGEGGMVAAVRPAFARAWANLRGKESGGRRLVSYCAGCCGFLSRVTPTVHLADLLCHPDAAGKDSISVTPTPFTYLQRLRLKRRLRQTIPLAGQRAASSQAIQSCPGSAASDNANH